MVTAWDLAGAAGGLLGERGSVRSARRVALGFRSRPAPCDLPPHVPLPQAPCAAASGLAPRACAYSRGRFAYFWTGGGGGQALPLRGRFCMSKMGMYLESGVGVGPPPTWRHTVAVWSDNRVPFCLGGSCLLDAICVGSFFMQGPGARQHANATGTSQGREGVEDSQERWTSHQPRDYRTHVPTHWCRWLSAGSLWPKRRIACRE